MIIHENKPFAIHEWDWKEQPDWKSINTVVNNFQEKFQGGVRIVEIETGADDYAIVIGTMSMSDEQAKQAYNSRYDILEGIDADEFDWDKAKKHLKEIRMQYTEIGMSGIHALTTVINPLLVRFEKGERSKDLFEAIMDLR